MFSRRCSLRKFFLAPGKRTNQAVVYCFALACQRYDMVPLWLMVMSNHYHAGVHDKHGCYPEFLRYFHSLLARCINCHLNRWENFWSTEQSGALHLADANAVLEKQVYSLCNAVKDHFVDRAHLWPGFCSYSAQLADQPVAADRPEWFFRELGNLPKHIELRFSRPLEFAHLSHEQWADQLRDAVEAAEREAAKERKEKDIPLLGRKAVRRQSPFSCPKSCVDRRVLRPRLATKNKWLRIELLTRDRRFQQRYRQALSRRRSGELDVQFPYGSYKLRLLGLVRCEPPPPG